MSDFDFDKYLNSKLANVDMDAKMQRLSHTALDKQDKLKALASQIEADTSWVNKLGMEAGTFEGNRVNDIASVVSGASRLAGHVTSLIPNALSAAEALPATDADYAAYNRVKQGIGTVEDVKRSKQLEYSNNTAKLGRDVNNFFDLTGIVDQTNRNALNEELGSEFEANWAQTKDGWNKGNVGDVASGLGSLIFNVGKAAVNNPSAAREYILENAPQVLAGAVGRVGKAAMGASNVGYAADTYQKGLENYAAKNGGQLPPAAERQEMAMYAASLALAEQVGDTSVLAAGKAANAFRRGSVDAGEDAATASFKRSLLNVGKATTGGAVGEALTEGYQTFAEGEIEGKPATALDIYKGATIGAMAGGGLSGGLRALGEVTGATPEKQAAKQQEAVTQAKEKEAFAEAVEAADPAVFLDPKAPTYNPAKAIGVMMAVAEKEGTTAEQFQEQLTKATTVVEDLETVRDSLIPAKLEEKIAEAQAKLATTTNPKYVEFLEDDIAEYTERLAELADPVNAKAFANRLTSVEREIKEAEATYAGFTRLATPAPSVADIKTALEEADSSDTVVSQKGGDTLINLSMTASSNLSADAALKIANNTANGLSDTQRTFLRQFSDARIAENELKDLNKVSKEILFGSENYVGINMFRERIGAAITAGSQTRADTQLAGLTTFTKDHAAKLELAETAPIPSQIIKEDDQWKINTGKRKSDKELKANGGINLHKNSTALVEAMRKEVTALTLAQAQLTEAVALRFKQKQVQSVQTPPAPAVAPVSPASLSREKREREGRVVLDESKTPVKPPKTVVQKQQVENKSEVSDVATVPTYTPEIQKAVDLIAAIDKGGLPLSTAKLNAIGRDIGLDISKNASPRDTIERIRAAVDRASSTASPTATLPVTPVADAPSVRATASATAEQSIEQGQLPVATEQQDEALAESQAAEVATAEEQQTIDLKIDAGRMSVFDKFVKEPVQSIAEMFNDAGFNPVSQFITQKATNEQYKTHRPLVKVKDFLSSIKDSSSFTGFLKFSEDETQAKQQMKALSHFRRMAKQWNPVIEANIGTLSDQDNQFNFRFQDMMQFMVDRNGDQLIVDENLLTAVSYAAYHWAVDTAGSPKITPEQINEMHGRDKDGHIEPGIWKYMSGVRGHEDVITNDIGEFAIQALGLTLRKDAPQDLLPRIKTALGAHGLLLLESQKLLTRKDHPLETIVSFLDPVGGEKIDAKKRSMYIYPAYDALKDFKEANKGTSNVVDKLFSADPGTRFATTEPVPFKQAFAQHTQQEISPDQRKAMEHLHSIPHTAIPEMFSALRGLGMEGLLKVAGKRDITTVHINNVESVQAQNDNLTNQFELMMEMLGVSDLYTDDAETEAKLKQSFYVQGEVWKNFRAGITTRSLNQQSSKIHRYMFGRPNWTAKIDTSNIDQVNDLRIAIAAGLGMKTDEKPNVDTLDDFDALITTPEIREIIESVKQGITTGSWDNVDAITDYAANAEGMMTLQALVTLAKFEHAVNAGNTEVEVTMLTGADGKTNGPILTHLALGAAADVDGLLSMMERGGMYVEGDGQPKHYSVWRSKGKQDLYEDLAKALVKNIPESNELKAIEVITGQLSKAGEPTKKARGLVKTPLTAFAFGSAMQGSILAMENKFISDIYDKIEGLDKDADRVQLLNAVNVLMKSTNPKVDMLDTSMSQDNLMSYQLTEAQEKALRGGFQQVMADPVTNTMNTYFAVFIQRRSDLNTTIGAAYAMYSAAYASARQAKLDQLITDGKLAYRVQKTGADIGKKIPLHDLSVEQEKEVRKQVANLLPVANTAYTVKTNNLAAGIYMGKSEAGLSKNPLHVTKINTTNQVYRGLKLNGDQGYANNFVTNSMVRVEADPGVAGTPYFIHSLDSANMHMALLGIEESLNVHDEIANSVTNITKAAGAINKATIENMLAFSPAREALGMLERITVATADGITKGTVSKEAVSQLLNHWQDAMQRRLSNMAQGKAKRPDPHTAAKLMFNMALDNAVAADKLRLGTIAQLGSIDQYVWEGGQFEIGNDIRQEAQKRLRNLETEMSTEADKALKTIIAFMDGKIDVPAVPVSEQADTLPEATKLPVGGAIAATVMGASTTVESVNAMEPAQRAEAIQKLATVSDKVQGTGMTPWGMLGTPTLVQDAIRTAFNQTPVMNRQQVVSLLSKNLSDGYKTILQQAARGLPENLRVELVTPDTDPAAVLDMPQENSRGWYVATKGGDNVVYVLSDSFVHSGLNAETLLHELIHGALAREVANPTAKASQSLVTDLTSLMEHVKKQPGADKFVAATKDIQEFLAWGMSNKPFQSFLNKIEYTNKTKGNKLVTAMKEFVRIITRGIWDQSALYAVLQNTAGLFEQAASNNNAADLNLSQVATPDSYTTVELYEALAEGQVNQLSAKDDGRIRTLMMTMVDKLAPIYGVFGKDIQSKTLSAASVFAAVQSGGQAPFATDALASGFGFNAQVGFMLEQIEVVVRTSIDGDAGQTSVAYRELTKLYNEAREQLKGKIDPAMYEYLFKMEGNADDRSDYLSRFTALALVHPEVNAAMNFRTKAVDSIGDAKNFMDKLTAVFEKLLEWVAGRWTKTYGGQQADAKLDALATQLALIESKRRAALNVQRNASVEAIEETFRGIADKGREKVDKFLKSDLFTKSNNGYMNMAGRIGSMAVQDRLDQLFLAYQTFSDTHFKHSQGTFAGILNELQGSNDHNVVFYKLLRMTKFLEGQRKDMITSTSKVVLQSFANKGKDLTKEMKEAVSAVVLRTDMSSLIDQFGLDGLQDLVSNKTALNKAIKDMEAKLVGNPHRIFYLNAAEGLGYQMAKGEAGMEHTLLNAYAAARLHGTDQMSRVTEQEAAQIEPVIDQLASLYALTFVENKARIEAVKVFEMEKARTDNNGNGLEMTLRMHQKLQRESKDRLFKEQEALMMKGYTPEIYDPNIELVIEDEAKTDDMKLLGYGAGLKLSKDKNDPEKSDRVLFARHGSGMLSYLSGAMSTTATKTKGSAKHSGNMDVFSVQGQYNINLMQAIDREKQGAVAKMFLQRVHAGTTNDSYMVPVINPNGKKVNYRYMMTNRVKDSVLQRDNRFEHLLGAMAGSIYDKQSAPKQNRTVVEALKAQYDLEFKTRAVSYVEVGPRSPDPEMRQIYQMLPDKTKEAIREVWKSEAMYVRIDLLDINFGYRKKSLSDVFKEDATAREGFTKMTAEFLGYMLGGRVGINATDEQKRVRDAKATIRVRNFEEVWQTFVKEAKDMIVVKSGSTLMGNVISNLTMLYAYGVPVTDMMRSHRIALRGAITYKKDSDELFVLQAKLDTGVAGSNADVYKKRIVQLKDAMARNPVKELIEAGLMPTIVEDVEVDDDIYSFKSKFVKRLESHTNKLNPSILNVGKTIYMTHDTKLYKALTQGTQLSDFVARYTLYQHMTTKKNPMSKEQAIQLASDAFINYDVPTHRNMQYANDMGLIRFTKYYLRIQKVLVHLYKENPARMMGLMMMGNYFDGVPSILDSSMMGRFGNNPLEWGAFEYLTSFDDLATVKVVGSPF